MATPESAKNLVFEGFRFDRRSNVLYRSREGSPEVPVALGGRALRLLRLLIEKSGEVVSKEVIIEEVWAGRAVEEANLNVQVYKLRRILDADREGNSCIQTFPGRGYSFVAPVQRPDADSSALPEFIAGDNRQLPPRLSIIVLPFENSSRDGRDQYIADGITDDLTTNLSRLGDLLVISRGTALTYRDRPVDARRISRELGVGFVVEGSVRRSGRRVRVNVQLIDAEAGQCVWAERLDRRVSNFVELQSEIAATIAGTIEPELLRSERSRFAGERQHVEGAYELYQTGLWNFYRYNREACAEAEKLFRRALSTDPRYASANAMLAITLCNAAYLGWAEEGDANYTEAYELAHRAVDLDSRSPTAHFSLGLVCMWTRRADRAMIAFQDAIDLNPSYAPGYVVLGQLHLYQGDPENALRLAEKGIRLSPRDPRLFIWLPAVAGAQYRLKQYDRAIEPGLRAWHLNRHWPAGLRYAAAAMGQLGQIEEAERAVRDLKTLNQTLDLIASNLHKLYQDPAAVDHILDGLQKAGL